MNRSHSYQSKIQYVCVGSVTEKKRMKNTFIKNWKGKFGGTNAITNCGISVMTNSMLPVDFDSMGVYRQQVDRSPRSR